MSTVGCILNGLTCGNKRMGALIRKYAAMLCVQRENFIQQGVTYVHVDKY